MTCRKDSLGALRSKLKTLKLQHDKQEAFKKLCSTQTSEGFKKEIDIWKGVCIEILTQLFDYQKSLNPELTMSEFMKTAASETARELLKYDDESGDFL